MLKLEAAEANGHVVDVLRFADDLAVLMAGVDFYDPILHHAFEQKRLAALNRIAELEAMMTAKKTLEINPGGRNGMLGQTLVNDLDRVATLTTAVNTVRFVDAPAAGGSAAACACAWACATTCCRCC